MLRGCVYFFLLFFSLCLHTCLRIIYCHWRWVYEPGLKSGQQKRRANIIFLTFDIIRYNDIRNRVSELAEARLSWRALTPALLSSVRFGLAMALLSGLVCFNCSANCTDLKGVKKQLFSFCL